MSISVKASLQPSLTAKVTICSVAGTEGLPALYRNSDNSFSESIPSGGTFVSPDIEVTDVDGSTRVVPSNVDVVCLPPPPCAPVTIEIDGNDEGNVDSGNTAEIFIEDTDSNPVTPTGVSRVGDQFTITVPAGAVTPTAGAYTHDSSLPDSVAAARLIDRVINEQQLLYLGQQGDIFMIATGDRHLLAIKNHVVGVGGELWVYGRDVNGAIGGADEFQWERIGSDSDWTKVCAGQDSSYAIRAGRLYVSGAGSAGRLGTGSTLSVSVFTQIGTDTDWQDVACGEGWAAAIKGDELLTTGSNANFRTGLGTSASNTLSWTVANNTETWVRCAAGLQHGAAITDDGRMFTWGNNSSGRTGQNTASGQTQTPTQEHTAATNWVMVDCGFTCSFAIKTNGTLYGTGNGGNGAVWGSSSNVNQFTQEALNDTDWLFLSTNPTDSCFAIKTNGELYTAGQSRNNFRDTTVNTLTQFGTDTDWKPNYRGNRGLGVSSSITLIK